MFRKFYMSLKSPAYILAFAFFWARLSFNSLSMGSIVHAALSNSAIKSTTIIVIFQAVASLLAISIFSFTKYLRNNKYADLVVVLFSFFVSFLLVFVSSFNAIWLFSIFLRYLLGIYIVSRLNAYVRSISNDNFLNTNKLIQGSGACAMILGWSIGPVISYYFGINDLFVFDSIITLILLVFIKFIVSEKEFCLESKVLDLKKMIYYLKESILTAQNIYIVVFFTWLIVGVLHILETPFLNQVIKATGFQISIAYGLAAVFNLIAISFIKPEKVKKYLYLIFLISFAFIMMLTCIYFSLINIHQVYILIAVFGLMNGLYTISYTSILQNLVSEASRTYAFLIIRFVSNLALLFSFIFTLSEDYKLIQKYLISASSLIFFFVVLRYVYKYKKKLIVRSVFLWFSR